MKKKNKIRLQTLEHIHENPDFFRFCSAYPNDRLHFYRVELLPSCIMLFFHIPQKEHPPFDHFLFLEKKKFTIVCATQNELSILKKHIEKFSAMDSTKTSIENMTPPEFLCTWLQSFLLEDLFFLSRSEQKMSFLEEQILEKAGENFQKEIQRYKQSISRLYRYYNHMLEFTDEFLRKKRAEISQAETEHFEDYKNRLRHLLEETRFLREYLMEIQELYQAEIDIRQNHIMKILTIVATIFFPLSLISGWYGMNFPDMPELKNPHSYPVVTGISICIVIFTLLFFKKKKFW